MGPGRVLAKGGLQRPPLRGTQDPNPADRSLLRGKAELPLPDRGLLRKRPARPGEPASGKGPA